MRKKILAANWKMNMTSGDATSFLETFLREINGELDVEVVIIPPFTLVGKVAEALSKNDNISAGAQNLYFEKSGAFTGEISAAMLRDLYVRYVVIGHSERRTIFGETDTMINKKVRAAIDGALKPILCIGETLAERDAGQVETVLETQLRADLAGLTSKEIADTVIAYEPVWAIGTGRTATPEQAQDAHAFIRKTVAAISDEATAAKVRIQYGGSVKPDNTEALLGKPDIDGALVGGASLDPRSFAGIVNNTLALLAK
ncbi:MAG TPA: triose-phosphate isomerase [Chthoniobacterales bacterium]